MKLLVRDILPWGIIVPPIIVYYAYGWFEHLYVRHLWGFTLLGLIILQLTRSRRLWLWALASVSVLSLVLLIVYSYMLGEALSHFHY